MSAFGLDMTKPPFEARGRGSSAEDARGDDGGPVRDHLSRGCAPHLARSGRSKDGDSFITSDGRSHFRHDVHSLVECWLIHTLSPHTPAAPSPPRHYPHWDAPCPGPSSEQSLLLQCFGAIILLRLEPPVVPPPVEPSRQAIQQLPAWSVLVYAPMMVHVLHGVRCRTPGCQTWPAVFFERRLLYIVLVSVRFESISFNAAEQRGRLQLSWRAHAC